jgi:hypothetical protein
MAYLVITDGQDPFFFEPGSIAGNESQLILKDARGAKIIKTRDIVAIMRSDFVEDYKAALAELERLKSGNPERN